MQFERRNIQDLSQTKYDRLAEFLSGGGSDLSLVNNASGLIYAFAGSVPAELSSTFLKNAVQIFRFDGMDMAEVGRLAFDNVTVRQESDGLVSVCGFAGGRMVFELSVNDALFDPLAINFFD